MTSHGNFVNNVQDFDCSFFGISHGEAILMEPQQRISLEVAWEAFEDALQVPVRQRSWASILMTTESLC